MLASRILINHVNDCRFQRFVTWLELRLQIVTMDFGFLGDR